ncbi:hypothetical protein CDD80_18 [Ophiocordyceps camponoti-rufipedis]|uniref:Coenzyme Q-binding protein COQ10 START domain-containing protein n=1 Tax=Ophiocordyceps camponoti-rufipedis TaxID=2004952 RepID=A0A2C5ZGV3_9HYPO|nr:hypothetical protein CDD80_18 [Ophiocordyceps camponoti-rufipedis]
MPPRILQLRRPQLILRHRPSSLPLIQHRLLLNLDAEGPPRHCTASRRLPFAAMPLYEIIVDIDSYKEFLTGCSQSAVTRWTEPDAHGRRWPDEAILTLGFRSISETFTSKLKCCPGVLIETVAGPGEQETGSRALISSLRTRWTLQPTSRGPNVETEVRVDIDYRMRHIASDFLIASYVPQVLEAVVKLFERRAYEKLRETS